MKTAIHATSNPIKLCYKSEGVFSTAIKFLASGWIIIVTCGGIDEVGTSKAQAQPIFLSALSNATVL